MRTILDAGYKFIPFAEFLGIPCLILTDLDSVSGQKGANGRIYYKSVPVSCGETTSNETLKWWVRKIKGLSAEDNTQIALTDITSMSPADKTRCKCHIEFQTTENGLCGHSLVKLRLKHRKRLIYRRFFMSSKSCRDTRKVFLSSLIYPFISLQTLDITGFSALFRFVVAAMPSTQICAILRIFMGKWCSPNCGFDLIFQPGTAGNVRIFAICSAARSKLAWV